MPTQIPTYCTTFSYFKYFNFFTLKNNAFSAAQKHFVLKRSQPKIYVKRKDVEMNQ